MKKIIKVLSVIVAPIIAVCTFLTSCKSCNGKTVEIKSDEIMRDIDEKPTQKAAYEQYTRQALSNYKSVADKHIVDGEVNRENEEVLKAASAAAAKLYAYACYNERTLDKYAYFSNQNGETDLGINGSAEANRQEYYLRVNESENTCGYRFHYTIKKVTEASGLVKSSKGLFESARIRITDKTDLLYRLEGSKIRVGETEHQTLGYNLLESTWSKGKNWGDHDIKMLKSEFIAPDKIEEDIVKNAGEDNITIHGNINILADNIVKSAMIYEEDDGCYDVMMVIDTDVANSDEASLKMLRKANSSNDCKWVSDDDNSGLMIIFRLWNNGLFRFYLVNEKWSGKISGFSGMADSQTTYHYTYSDSDCDMTDNLKLLESF